jgi:glutamate-1-semialdehyde 2,1-aminomutase/spore coat polysaccharide biosynthesis protein SpsF
MSSKNENLLWDKALELMPRGTQTMSKCPDQFVNGVYPKFVESARGAYLKGLDGKEYLDYMCGLGPIILGYNHRRTNEAIKKQIDNGIIFSLPTLLEQELAELICEVVPAAEQVRFAKNGTDATLAAVRISRSYTKKEKIAKCGYHGWGDWHGITLRPYGIPSSLKDVVCEFQYNDLDSLEAVLRQGDVAAVIMEAQALTAPAEGFLEGVRRLCDEYEAILIFDEVVTGFRWNLGGAQKHYGVTPDLCCLGKAIANGMPLSAIAGKKKFMSEMDHIFFSMTFGGECLSLAAAIETIKELKTLDYDHIWRLGDKLDEGIKRAAAENDLKINFAGSAPRHNLTFSSDYEDAPGMKDLFYQEMVKKGILFPNVIYIQFSHTDEDIEKTIEAAKESFAFVKKHMHDVNKALQGSRSVSVFRKNT